MSGSDAAAVSFPGGGALSSSWLRRIGLAACTLLAVASRGYGYGVEDQNLYLPFVMKWIAPSLFPSDPILTLGFAGESVVWVLLAILGRAVPLEAILLLAYLGASYATLYLVYRLAHSWWGDEAAAWIAVFLWIPAYTVPGVANATFDSYLTTRVLGSLFVLGALEASFRHRYGASAIWVLVGALVHIITIAPVAAGLVLTHGVRGRWREAWQVSGAFTGAAGLLWAFGAGTGHRHPLIAFYSGDWLAAVHHTNAEMFPLQWSVAEWRSLFFLLSCFGLLVGARLLKGQTVPEEREGLLVPCGVLLSGAVGVAGTAAGVTLLAQFCLLRGMWLILLLLVLILSGPLAELFRAGGVWSAGLGAFAAAGWTTEAPILQALAVGCAMSAPWIPRLEDLWHWLRVDRHRARTALLLLLLSGLLVYLGHYWHWIHPPPLLTDSRPWIQAGILTAGVTCAALLLPPFRRRRAVLALPMALGLFFLLFPPPPVTAALHDRPWFRRMYGTRMADVFVKAARTRRDREALRAMGELVRRKVPGEATVAVPCDWMTFRLDSLRSPFVTYKDGAPCEFDAAYCSEWLRRVRSVRAIKEEGDHWIRTPDEKLPESAWRDLARAYSSIRLEYLVSRQGYDFPVVGSAGGMTLYRLPP